MLEMDTHVEIALPAGGDYIFKAMKSVVSIKSINYIPEALIVRIY